MYYSSYNIEWPECQKLGKQINEIFENLGWEKPLWLDSRSNFNESLKHLFDHCEQNYPADIDWKKVLKIPPVAIEIYNGMGKIYVPTGLQFWKDVQAGKFTMGQLQMLAGYVLTMALTDEHPLVKSGELKRNECFPSNRTNAEKAGHSATNADKLIRPLKKMGYLEDTGKWTRYGTKVRKVNLFPEDQGEQPCEAPAVEPKAKECPKFGKGYDPSVPECAKCRRAVECRTIRTEQSRRYN